MGYKVLPPAEDGTYAVLYTEPHMRGFYLKRGFETAQAAWDAIPDRTKPAYHEPNDAWFLALPPGPSGSGTDDLLSFEDAFQNQTMHAEVAMVAAGCAARAGGNRCLFPSCAFQGEGEEIPTCHYRPGD